MSNKRSDNVEHPHDTYVDRRKVADRRARERREADDSKTYEYRVHAPGDSRLPSVSCRTAESAVEIARTYRNVGRIHGAVAERREVGPWESIDGEATL